MLSIIGHKADSSLFDRYAEYDKIDLGIE
jgi:hypothetical protein